MWLWPKKIQGDGLTYPVVGGTDPRLPYYWPPRDPDELRPSIFSSKYKRQQAIKQILQENPNAVIDESDGYYDSGSFVTDSEAEYSQDEEGGMRHLINNRLYDLSGTYYDGEKYKNNNNYQYRDSSYDSEDGIDDDDDSIPLSNYRKIPSSKDD